jgi:hypothetical protein
MIFDPNYYHGCASSKFIMDCYRVLYNTTNTIITSYHAGEIVNWNGANGITANASYLYTTRYTILGVTLSPTASSSGFTIPPTNVSSTIPQTANGINVSGSSTINFNSNSVATITLTPGVTFPKYGILIIAIIVILMGAGMLGFHQGGHMPFAIMILGMWIAGIFAYPILGVALILTIVFVIEEFVHHKDKPVHEGQP